MSMTQIFSHSSLKANLDEYLIRHDLVRSPPVIIESSGEIDKDSIKNALAICIKNILMDYSKEMYDYFRFEMDHMINRIYAEVAPNSRKRKHLISYNSEEQDRIAYQKKQQRKVCLRSRTGYLMYCQYLRDNVPNYRSLKPQKLWHELSNEEKQKYVEMGKQSKPLKWSQKTKFKSLYGKETYENLSNTPITTPVVELSQHDTDSDSSSSSNSSSSSTVTVKLETNTNETQNHPSYGIKRPYIGIKRPYDVYLLSDEDSSSTTTDSDDNDNNL